MKAVEHVHARSAPESRATRRTASVSALLLDTNDEVGGVVTYHRSILRHAPQAGLRLQLACQRASRAGSLLASIPGVRSVDCDFGTKDAATSASRWRALLGDVSGLPRVLGSVRRLARLVRDERLDLVYTSDKTRAALIALAVAKLARRPLVLHLHGNCTRSRALRFLLPQATTVIANSAATRADYVAWLGAAAERIVVIHNGLDVAVAPDGPDLRRELELPADALVIGTASRLEPAKGQEEFVRAAAQVAPRCPGTFFLIVGDESIFAGNASFRARLEGLAGELGLQQRLRFAGFRSDMDAVYRTLDVAVNAAWQEAFGMVVVEAMAYGRPVVATRAGGVPEIIEDGVSGFLVPPRDADALARAIEQVASDARLREQVGAAARERVRQHFQIEHTVSRLAQVLRATAEARA